MDSISFPREGSQLSLEWRASRQSLLEADADFDQLLLAASYAKTWGRHTVLTTLRWDATVSGTAADSRLFRMGGFFDISGLNRNQLSGQHATRVGAAYYRRIGDLALFPAFAGASLELGNAWESRDDISSNGAILGGSFWAGVDTPIGPVYIGYGRAEGRRGRVLHLARPSLLAAGLGPRRVYHLRPFPQSETNTMAEPAASPRSISMRSI